MVGLCLLLAIGAYGFSQYRGHASLDRQKVEPLLPQSKSGAIPEADQSGFKCDGRTHCSQMTSCTEAKLFLKNCPGTEMDGNDDGVPCEQQWCTSPLAN